jgi:hypothetical protein
MPDSAIAHPTYGLNNMKYLFSIIFLSISTAQAAPIKITAWGSAAVIDVRAYDINNIEIYDFNAAIGGDILQTFPYAHSGSGQPIVTTDHVALTHLPQSTRVTASSSSPEDYDRAYFLAFVPFEPFSSNPYVAPINQIGMAYSDGFDELILSNVNANIDRFEFDHKIQYGVDYINDNPNYFRAQTKIEIDFFGAAITPGGAKDFVFLSRNFKPEDSFSFETLYTRHLSMDQFDNSSFFLHEDFYIKTQVELNVSPVPVPAALWLFSSALIGLASVTRKNKTSLS